MVKHKFFELQLNKNIKYQYLLMDRQKYKLSPGEKLFLRKTEFLSKNLYIATNRFCLHIAISYWHSARPDENCYHTSTCYLNL